VNLRGNDVNDVEKIRFMLNACQIIVTDGTAVPTGIQYAADYSSTYSSRSLVDKEYVDNVSGGLNPLAAVAVATTGDTTLSGLTIVDGVQTTTGMRILVKNQISGATNGVYSASTGTWGRTSDFDGTPTGEVVQNSFMAVLSGSTNAHTSWILNTPNPITVDVTPLSFVLYSASAGVVAGNGICVTQSGGNNVIAVKLPAICSGLCSDVSGVYLNPSVAGNGICLNNGVLSVDGLDIAGNSLSWVANQLAVNITGGTLSTALSSKLNISAFNTYSGSTLTNINSRLLTSTFAAYTGATEHVTCTDFDYYTGTTVPNSYVNKTNFNIYTGATSTAIGLKANITSPTFLVSACAPNPIQNDKSNCIATTCWYSCQCATATPLMNGVGAVGTSLLWTKQDHVHPSDTSRVEQTLFNTYTGTTAPATFALKTSIATYTGTTAPAQFVGKTAFNTYSGTTVPATYVSITNFNVYTGTTNTRLNSKASLSGATFTGVVNVPKPAQNDNTTCVATTSWYISQAGTANPLMNGTVAVGTSNLFSRQDHIHASDTSRQATITGAATTITTSNLTIDRALVSDGSGKVAVSTVTSAQLIAAVANVYGSEYQLASDLTSTSTTSTTPVAKVTMTTTSLPAGTYKITVAWMWSRNSSANSARFNLTIGGTAQGTRTTMDLESQDPSDIHPDVRIYYVALSGVNTIVFNHWGESAAVSTTTSDATIELIRVA
jgi:hypothetical protein